MDNDLISIIIPVYNAEKYIEQTINTVKEQTYKNWEAIFVDDASQDKSKLVIKRYLKENIKLIELTENVGPARARNEALKIAKGKYIAYLDADDLWEKDKLEVQYHFMKDNNYEFTYTSYKHINRKNKISKKVKIENKLDYKKALKRIRVLPITSMIDVEKIEKDLLVMPDLKYGEDIATWLRILKLGYIAYGIDEPLAYYRKNKNTRSSNKFKSMHSRWKIYRELEEISLIKSIYYFLNYIVNSILRRL